MPLRLALPRRVIDTSIGEYVCSSCLLKAAVGGGSRIARLQTNRKYRSPLARRHDYRTKLRPDVTFSTKQYASTTTRASNPATSAPSSVPHSYRELYQGLSVLQDSASSYVNLSQLHLLSRSLESKNPVIRVAILGLGSNGTSAAGNLARVLTSDALSDEEPWEKELLASSADGKSLLLRYSDVAETVQSNPLVQTLSIPSSFLRRNSLEILVTTLNTSDDTASSVSLADLGDAILVPSLTTPTSTGGRVGFVRYPVHKAVIVADGLAGAAEYGRFPHPLADETVVATTLNLTLRSSSSSDAGLAERETPSNAVDVALASHALDLFRDSKANGARFSDEWQRSRVSLISRWVTSTTDESKSSMAPAVRNLVNSVLSSVSKSIARSESAQTTLATAATVPELKRTALQSAISNWSSEAHRDLQVNLTAAFDSRSWRRTAWWRLVWRIDDISVSTADILRGSWLVEAEQSLAFISGRIIEANLATENQLREAGSVQLLDERSKIEMADYETNKANKETVAELMQMPSMLATMQQQSGVNALFDPPWPQTINLSRQFMLRTLVSDLHIKAQSLLFTSVSTITGTTALGAWFYFATAGIALYEAGAIAALGLVWSLRRLQTKWGKERDDFANTIREDARRVLGEVEGRLRKIVSEGGRVGVRPEDARSWREARQAIESCQEALEKIHKGN